MTTMRPRDIEEASFRIIDAEAGRHDRFSADQWAIVRRMIHATADFDFTRSVRFHPQAVDGGCAALQAGAALYADTAMLAAAVGRRLREAFGCNVFTLVADEDVVRESRETGQTRSAIAMRRAAPRLEGAIVAIGNAPTALHEAIDLCERRLLRPALIIGLPVGFVEARESKERLWMSDLVCLTNLDRKGGTPATAAAVNALIRLCAERSGG